tara:strand:- start:537 stop:950 length:414 start_codon:yes stop_codon:yes gene_type:complete
MKRDGLNMTDVSYVESKYAVPLAECPNCDHMLPQGLGEITCEICSAVCKITHEPTVQSLISESLPCPSCSTVLVAGTDERPVKVECSACSINFVLTQKTIKVEIDCPSCKRQLRIRPRPGTRELDCPACQTSFNVTF